MTDRQREVLKAIRDTKPSSTWAAGLSVPDVVEAMGSACLSTVRQEIVALEASGHVSMIAGRHRTIRITEQGMEALSAE